MRISYSILDTFQSCPLKYKFQEIDKKRVPKSKEAVFGTTIHSTMKFIHTPGILSPTLDQAMEHFSNSWNPGVFENPDEERAAFSQGVKIIQEYYKSNNPADANIVDLESRFQFEIGKSETETHVLSGIIDRIDKTDEGYEIIDYKTTKKMPSQEKVDNDLQLSIYLKAFLDRYPKEIENLDKIKVSLYYLKHGVKLSSSRTREQLEKSSEFLLDTIKEIEKGEFEPKISPLCDWCGYQKICPMWKHKFREKQEDGEIEKNIQEYIDLKSAMSITSEKVSSLQEKIIAYMNQEGLGQVFGESGSISKTVRRTYKYNSEKIKEILKPLDKWEEVLKIDGVALKKIVDILPVQAREKIKKFKIIDKTSESLTIKKK